MRENIFKWGIKGLLNLVGYEIVNSKQFGRNILQDLTTILKHKKAPILFDIGANLGQTSNELVHYFPQSIIHSFEPDPDSYLKLLEKTQNHANIKSYNIGFGLHEERILMNINKASGGNSILSMSETISQFAEGDWTKKIDQREVEITTLNSFCTKHNIRQIELVKLDTQGYELKILEGGDQVIVPHVTKAVYTEVLFVELYQRQAYFEDIYNALTKRGFRFVGLYNNFRKAEPPHFLLWCDALFVSEII